MRRNGETNPGTILAVVALLCGGFYVFHAGPVYTGNLEVKEAVGEAFNKYFLDGEVVARDMLLIRLNVKAKDQTHLEVDEEGTETWEPGFGIQDDNVTFTYDEKDKRLTVRVEYDRVVDFKPLKYRKVFHVVAEKSGQQTK